MNRFLTKGRVIAILVVLVLIVGGWFLYSYAKSHKQEFAVGGLSLLTKVTKLLPIEADTKQEIATVDSLVSTFTKQDGVTHTLLVMLQNNYELRPGGGFLGQYGVLKVKDGKIVSFSVEDANLLDQRITAKITPPYPLTRYMQIKKWKFRDSNWSPSFPENVAKAEYFYRLGGGYEKFEGAIAVNADVLNDVLGVTGPITIPGFGTYSKDGGAIDLEEDVEKAYLGDDVPAELKQARKNVMKKLAAEIVSHVSGIGDLKKLTDLGLEELRNKNVQLYFKDEALQKQVEAVHWDGEVEKDWTKDYLMVVDANVGALKSDYYVKRSLDYVVDFTVEKPTATVTYTYDHTATHGDWRTSDYHSYARVIAPKGSVYVENSRQKTGGVSSADSADWNKSVFGYKVDCLIGQTLPTSISYTLPSTVTAENYELLIQKQSGTGTIPVKVTVKAKDKEYVQTADLRKDLRLSFRTTDEKR
ncbi:MAG: DUF4012 domain-containing protein [Candidatus Moranbacteria bacterium]|nr:DUF4012 domain-containing protein [Candidatus Moranbacteria bacterium]NTW45968.1 DUF4012 domain-containing protein [Candidatus Moranbacteria bacterium]